MTGSVKETADTDAERKLQSEREMLLRSLLAIVRLLPGFVSKLNPCTWKKSKAHCYRTLHTLYNTPAGPSSPIQYSTVPINVGL